MKALILNKNLDTVGSIDVYKSFIWSDRYNEYGDFELYIPIDIAMSLELKKGYYLWNAESEHVMIVESFSMNSDPDEGAHYKVSGRSLETILSRRIVWGQKTFKANDDGVKPNLQNGIETLLNENVINPEMSIRKIDNFVFKPSTDGRITSLTFEAQYTGEDLYTIISTLCKERNLGFKITLTDDKKFVFELYKGLDRSYEQLTEGYIPCKSTDDGALLVDTDIPAEDVTPIMPGWDYYPLAGDYVKLLTNQLMNPYVVFAPKYKNILNTEYLDSDISLKNVTLVAGEGEYDEETEETKYVTYVLGFETGLDRREIFTNATGVSTEDESGGVISAQRYQALLRQKGIDTLIENTAVTAFNGEVNQNNSYIYGVDYQVGDTVQLADEYGHEGCAYISEYVMSCDEGGISMYPTFQIIQKGVYER